MECVQEKGGAAGGLRTWHGPDKNIVRASACSLRSALGDGHSSTPVGPRMAVISIVIPISRPSVQMARTLEVPASEWLFSPSIIALWPLLRMVLFIFPRESILGRFVWLFYVPSLWPRIAEGRLWQHWCADVGFIYLSFFFLLGGGSGDATAAAVVVVVVSLLSYW